MKVLSRDCGKNYNDVFGHGTWPLVEIPHQEEEISI